MRRCLPLVRGGFLFCPARERGVSTILDVDKKRTDATILLMKTLDQNIATPPPANPEYEQILKLAEDVGSVGDIDKATGQLVFKTKDDADAFRDFCGENKVEIDVIEESTANASSEKRYRIAPKAPVAKANAYSPAAETAAEVKEAPRKEMPKAGPPESIDARFDRVLKGRFAKVPHDKFTTKLEPFTSVTLAPFKTSSGKYQLNATFFYETDEGRDISATWTLFEDGVVSGRIPNGLKVTRDEIKSEILRLIEQIDLTFWHKANLTMFPEADEGTPRPPRKRGEGGEEPPFDMDRLDVLRALGGRTGFFLDEFKLRGYHGVIIHGKRGSIFVVDNQVIGNASFVIPTGVHIEISENPSDGEIDEAVQTYLKPIIDKAPSRKRLVAEAGAVRIVHIGDWQNALRKAVDNFTK